MYVRGAVALYKFLRIIRDGKGWLGVVSMMFFYTYGRQGLERYCPNGDLKARQWPDLPTIIQLVVGVSRITRHLIYL